LYTAYQYGSVYTDNNEKNMTFKNVLVLKADTKTVDSYGRLAVNLVGSGDGWFCCGGKYVPITWHRDSDQAAALHTPSPTALLSASGVGKTFISVIPTGGTFGSKVTFKEPLNGEHGEEIHNRPLLCYLGCYLSMGQCSRCTGRILKSFDSMFVMCVRVVMALVFTLSVPSHFRQASANCRRRSKTGP
jgi:hypothetical protein